MRLYGTLTKIDAQQRIVSGYASTEATDAQGETITKAAIEAALDDYLEFANIREMHQLSAVGTAEEASVDAKGLYLAARIVDDTAWGKVTSGVYKGFSVGGKVLARDKDDKKVITKIALTEISLVDRPSNPEARFDVWKAAGADPIAAATAALDRIDHAIQPNGADALMKIFQQQGAEIDRLNKRIEELLAEPAPAKTAGTGTIFAISKEDDAGGAASLGKSAPSADDLAAALAGMPEEDRALLLIKASRQLPRPVTMTMVAQ